MSNDYPVFSPSLSPEQNSPQPMWGQPSASDLRELTKQLKKLRREIRRAEAWRQYSVLFDTATAPVEDILWTSQRKKKGGRKW